ncbi:MAG: hypothetical protein LBO09_00170 [Candidatus Peribacteria bacterium]|jgi:hypothetical protein|nr:hypothetical protein [Candidatus Peribacteria bacterium]
MKKSVYLSLFVVAISAFFLLMSRMDREEAVLYSDPEMSMYDVDNEEAENEETEEYSEIDTAISEEIDEEEIGEEYPDVNASDEINDEEAEVENAEPEINESEIANDTMMTVSEAVSFSLPSDFTEIEYVTFTEGQYLDTNIDHLGDKTYNIKYLYTEKTSPTRFEILFGARPAASGGDKDAVSAEIRDPNLYWNYSKVGYPNSIGTDYWQVTTGNGGARNTVYERNFRQWTIYDEGMNALGSLNSVDNTPDANPIHIYLGALNKDNGAPIAGYWFRGNFYKFSIYDNDTSKMLIDLLPVQQISTSNIGFFDKVSGNFYLQNSSGAFTLLDVTAPTITAIIATPTTPTSGSVTVSIEATDNTELASQAYSFDDGATRQTDNRQAFSENQTLNIQVRDMAGNIATGSISFTTIDTSPVT